ncbi:MAG: SAM-dependent chlorinase/fluorinase [Gemmatimonadetes bacterium]|nr:SAM-dependent chlorinase/fluorinase [Gemmatimonadota bacterium]
MTGRERPIVTLLTDFGEGSYVASVKGVLLSITRSIQIVDITHSLMMGDVGPAGYVLSNTSRYFPPGTIHLAVVDPGVGMDRLPLIVRADGHYYVGPDNGLFGDVLRTAVEVNAFHVREEKWLAERISPTFHGRDLFAPVAARLAGGVDPGDLGDEIATADLIPSPIPTPIRTRDELTGQVVWADSFGNLMTNLTQGMVEEWCGDDPYQVVLGWERIRNRIRTFQDTSKGNLAFLFGSWNTLEVVVSEGSAATRLGVSIGEPVRLERVVAG